MYLSKAKRAVFTAALYGLLITLFVPSGYAASNLGSESFSPRYQKWLKAIQDDGWVKGDKQYYSELKRRILRKGKTGVRGQTNLFELKRYCEWLPQCAPRKVYVIRFLGKGECFYKEGDRAKNTSLQDYIHKVRKGVYIEGFWDFFFAERFHFGPDCIASPSERYPRNVAQWRHGVDLVSDYLAMTPVGSKIILAGFGLGGTSALLVARQMLEKHRRSVDYLILYDPVGPGGSRKQVQEIWSELTPGPVKVRNLYHRWQTQACLPYDYGESGLLTTAGVAVANQKSVDFKEQPEAGDCKFLWRTNQAHTDMKKGLEVVNDLGMVKIIKRAAKGETVLCPKEMGCP